MIVELARARVEGRVATVQAVPSTCRHRPPHGHVDRGEVGEEQQVAGCRGSSLDVHGAARRDGVAARHGGAAVHGRAGYRLPLCRPGCVEGGKIGEPEAAFAGQPVRRGVAARAIRHVRAVGACGEVARSEGAAERGEVEKLWISRLDGQRLRPGGNDVAGRAGEGGNRAARIAIGDDKRRQQLTRGNHHRGTRVHAPTAATVDRVPDRVVARGVDPAQPGGLERPDRDVPRRVQRSDAPVDAAILADSDRGGEIFVADRRDNEVGIVGSEGDLANPERREHERPALPAIGAAIDAVASRVELAAHRRRQHDIGIGGRDRKVENVGRVQRARYVGIEGAGLRARHLLKTAAGVVRRWRCRSRGSSCPRTCARRRLPTPVTGCGRSPSGRTAPEGRT